MGSQHSKFFGGSADSSNSSHICPVQSLNESAAENAVGSMSFYQFNRILSGVCASFALVVLLFFMFMHATHLSKPSEQIKILRISLIIPLYAIVAYISITAPAAYVYLKPWLEFVQSICLGSYFLLVCEFVSPSEEQRDVFFAELRVPDKKSPTGTTDGLVWFRKQWILVFQYPIVSLLAAIITDITQAAGIYCEFETKPYFAKLWLTIASSASLAIAVMTVVKFYLRLKAHLARHQLTAKILAFKLIVFLSFLQSITFMILNSTGSVLSPTAKMTYADLNIGIPNLLICLEMVPLSLFFFYAYPWTPYLLSRQQKQFDGETDGAFDVQFTQQYQGGPLGVRAYLAMWNPAEIVQAIVFAFRMMSESRSGGGGSERLARTPSSQEYNLLPHQQQMYSHQQQYNQAYHQQNIRYGEGPAGEYQHDRN